MVNKPSNNGMHADIHSLSVLWQASMFMVAVSAGDAGALDFNKGT